MRSEDRVGYRLLLMALSFSASNFLPQPLNWKSSNLTPQEINPWSRAQVSLVGHWWNTTFCKSISASESCWRTNSTSGATTSSISWAVMACAISTYVSVISFRYGFQSVSSCGHVSCTPHCCSHSAGNLSWEESLFSNCSISNTFGAKLRKNERNAKRNSVYFSFPSAK